MISALRLEYVRGSVGALTILAAVSTPAPVFATLPQSPVSRPPQEECAAVRDVDLRALERGMARYAAAEERRRRQGDLPPPRVTARAIVDRVQIADWAERRPSGDTPVVIRARMEPAGGHVTDHRAVVWREADGSWWFWKQVLGGPPASPPPPPRPEVERGSAEWLAWEAAQPPADRSMEDRNYPPEEGRVAPSDAARLEAVWRDTCRAWDPDFWPAEIPLNRRIDGSRVRLCPQDRSPLFGEIAEPGRPPRLVGGACRNGSPSYRLIELAIYVTGDPTTP